MKIKNILVRLLRKFNIKEHERFVLFVVSFLLSVGMYITIHVEIPSFFGVEDYKEIVSNVEIQYLVDDGYVVTEDAPTATSIVFRGSEALVKQTIQAGSYRVLVDLRSKDVGTYQMELEVSGVDQSVRAVPTNSLISVTLDTEKQKELPVSIVPAGLNEFDTERSFTVSSDVEKVEMKGPAKVIDKIVRVVAEVRVDTTQENFSKKYVLKAYNEDGDLTDVELHPQNVEVKVEYGKKVVKGTTEPTIQYSSNQELFVAGITPKTSKTITVFGDEESYKKDIIFPVFLDVTNVKEEKEYTFTGKVQFPAALTSLEKEKTYRVKMEYGETYSYKNIPIYIKTADGKEDPTGETTDLLIKGAPTLLKQLDRDSIRVVADSTVIGNQLPLKLECSNSTFFVPEFEKETINRPMN